MDTPNVGPDSPTVLTLFDAFRNGPFGRMVFSHCDLAGTMDHRNAFIESERAMSQLLDRVLT